MRRAARLLLALLAGLAMLAVAGYFVLARTTRDWFDADLALRSRLAVSSSRQSLESNWIADRARLTETLAEITRDERIMGAAACSPRGSRIDPEADAVVQGPRRTLVRPYPISIEWPVHWLDKVPNVAESRVQVPQELGLPADALLGVGIDRLEFTSAARDLTEALIVNPYDLRQASDAMAAVLRMPADEQRERMRSMRRLVSEFNVYRWAGRMLVDAAELRRKERMSGRFGMKVPTSEGEFA